MYEFGTIVLVPFPFTDLSSAKVRPALVVSKQEKEEDVIVCFISSKDAKKCRAILPLPSDEETGLKVRSHARFDKIATLHKRILLGEIGRVDREYLRKNSSLFFGVFGF
jgi:mRNA interferase MazF